MTTPSRETTLLKGGYKALAATDRIPTVCDKSPSGLENKYALGGDILGTIASAADAAEAAANAYSDAADAAQTTALTTAYEAADAVTLASALAALNTATPANNSRALNSNFTPHATKWTLCAYTISISCTLTLSGGQTGAVELRSDTAGTPTTVCGKVSVTNSGTLIVGVSIVNAQEQQVVYLCPPGHNVRLVSSGAGTISITGQVEIVVG